MTRKWTLNVLLVVLALVITVCNPLAGSASEKQAGFHGKLDRNNDGSLTQEEWRALDKNKDGRISGDEWNSMDTNKDGRISAEEEHRALDINRDGQVSKKEFSAFWPEQEMANYHFNRLDKNKDGTLNDGDKLSPGFFIKVFKW